MSGINLFCTLILFFRKRTKATQNYVRFEVFTAVTMKNAVSWYIKTQFIPHGKHFSDTEPSRLMLCKIRGFHGGDYEEYRLLKCDAVWLL
jgi:hypothetical protein